VWVHLTIHTLTAPEIETTVCIATTVDGSGSGVAARVEISQPEYTEVPAAAPMLDATRLYTVLDNMPVMLDAFDRDLLISFWNKECERVTGYSAAEVIGNPKAVEMLYPDAAYRQQMFESWAEIGNDYYNFDWMLTCKDGSQRIISWSNISERVPIYGWETWAIGVDVTDQRRAQESLLDNTRLELALHQQIEVNDFREKIMHRVGHEIRNPLAVISVLSETLERYADKLTEEQRRDRLRQIRTQVQRLTEALEEVWVAAKGEMHASVIQMAEFDLEQLCREQVETMEMTSGSQHRLLVESDGTLGRFYGDPRLLRYVLTNLLTNAIKYSGERTRIWLSLTTQDDQAVLEVRDEGRGMSETDIQRIFEPFYRGENGKTVSGLGIGMSVVKNIVAAHHGRIAVESALGIGTTITVRLPKLQ